MSLAFELSSGFLLIDKKTFVKDILLGKSSIRSLINSNEPGFKEPKIEKYSSTVKVVFDDASDIDLGADYQEYFKEIKEKYRDLVKGKLVIRVICHATYFSVLDLNSEEDKLVIY